MKSCILMGLLIGLGHCPYAQSKQLVLEYSLGEEGRPQHMKYPLTCRISLDDIKTKTKKQEILNALKIAIDKQDTNGFHITAQIPSVLITGYLPTQPTHSASIYKKFILLKDHSSITQKAGKEAEALIQYASQHCDEKLRKAIKAK